MTEEMGYVIGLFMKVMRSQRGGRGFESLHLHQENLLKSGCCVIRPHPDFFCGDDFYHFFITLFGSRAVQISVEP